jgi:hypothetical protein
MAGLRFRRGALRLGRRGVAAVRCRPPPGVGSARTTRPRRSWHACLSDAHYFRKLVAGFCMVLAPLFLLLSAIVHPGFKTDEAEFLASAARSLDAWYLAEILVLISIVLAWGLAAARAISPVMAGCIGLGAVLLSVAFATAVTWLLIVAAALLLVGVGSTGMMVLRESDADWEHTPQFRGFRAAPRTS